MVPNAKLLLRSPVSDSLLSVGDGDGERERISALRMRCGSDSIWCRVRTRELASRRLCAPMCVCEYAGM